MYRVVDAVITAEDLPGIDLNSVIIIPDDAIYSGRQMATQLSRLYRVVPEEVPVVIASGFISVTGRELLSSMGERVRFPVQSESFDVVRLPRDVYVHHQRASDLHTIYFDHKLADMYSIYQTIYAFGVGLSDESDVFPFRPVSLIDNCDPVSIVYEAYGEGYSVEETVEYFLEDVFTGVDIQDSIEICPFSPYKKLKYSLRGRVIEAIEEFVV
jgi:hypothetical protein